MFSRLLVAAFLLLSPAALAHKPIAINDAPTSAANPIVLEDPEISQVVYHDTSAGADQVWLRLDGQQNQPLSYQVGMPVIERFRNARPAVALIGPGLPAPEVELPFAIPAGMGVMVHDTVGLPIPTPFDEFFTGTQDWMFPLQETTFPGSGSFYLVGYFPRGEQGKLVVVVGEREDFNAGEIFGLFNIIRPIREFHEIGGLGGGLIVGPILLVFSLIAVIFSLMFA